ncbi:MAG: hypothetical protein ACK4YF_05305 [Exilispira sp.]
MKKIIIILALIFLLSIPVFAQAQYNFLGLGIIGLSNTTLSQLSENQAQFFDSAVWGINGRLKLSKFFGVAFDLFYVGTQYYWNVDDNNTNQDYWYGPASWSVLTSYFPNDPGLSQEDWLYYHDEFYANLNLGIYLPLAFLQLYFECGPSFFFTEPSEAYDYDYDFAEYYDSIYGEGGFTVGLNFKIGLDIFVTRSISIGAFLYFLEPSIQDFIAGIQNGGSDYIMSKGYVGLEIMLWL